MVLRQLSFYHTLVMPHGDLTVIETVQLRSRKIKSCKRKLKKATQHCSYR